MKKIKKIISNVVMTALLVVSVPVGAFAASSETTEVTSILTENLVEVVNIEGVDFKYENFKDDSGNNVTRVTNLQTNESNEVTSTDDAIYLDGKQIAIIETIEESAEQNESPQQRGDWIQMGQVAHKKISWLAGTTASIVLAALAQELDIPSQFIKNCLGGALGVLAASTIGGTLHYTNWFRDLVFGQVQYKTDWSFVDSNGKRYGTYTYQSQPIYTYNLKNL